MNPLFNISLPSAKRVLQGLWYPLFGNYRELLDRSGDTWCYNIFWSLVRLFLTKRCLDELANYSKCSDLIAQMCPNFGEILSLKCSVLAKFSKKVGPTGTQKEKTAD